MYVDRVTGTVPITGLVCQKIQNLKYSLCGFNHATDSHKTEFVIYIYDSFPKTDKVKTHRLSFLILC